MVNQQMLDYLRQCIQQGVSREHIKSTLMTHGWQAQDIEGGFHSIDAPNIPTANSAAPVAASVGVWKMKFFSSLQHNAIQFLEPYKTKDPATYAAAEQAIGAILITDGFIGIDNPFGQKKRPGIFGTISGIFFGVIFTFIPTFFGNISGINDMTAGTSATVVSVGQANFTGNSNGNSSASCPLTVRYLVNGQEYSNQSSISSSSHCSLSAGQIIPINYNPTDPGSWAYGAKTMSSVLQIFFWIGLLVVISSIITFFIRLFSIIFGWKLLHDGRKNAASLPAGTNLQTMIDEIKRNFTATIFGFGGAQSGYVPGIPPSAPGPMTPHI